MNPKDGQGKEITWRNAAALDGYVKRLNDVADRLAERNRSIVTASSTPTTDTITHIICVLLIRLW